MKGAEERLSVLAEVFAADEGLAPASGSKLESALESVRLGPRRRRPGSVNAAGSSPGKNSLRISS